MPIARRINYVLVLRIILFSSYVFLCLIGAVRGDESFDYILLSIKNRASSAELYKIEQNFRGQKLSGTGYAYRYKDLTLKNNVLTVKAYRNSAVPLVSIYLRRPRDYDLLYELEVGDKIGFYGELKNITPSGNIVIWGDTRIYRVK